MKTALACPPPYGQHAVVAARLRSLLTLRTVLAVAVAGVLAVPMTVGLSAAVQDGGES